MLAIERATLSLEARSSVAAERTASFAAPSCRTSKASGRGAAPRRTPESVERRASQAKGRSQAQPWAATTAASWKSAGTASVSVAMESGSTVAELVQAVVVEAEVVRDLVDDGDADLLDQLVLL